MTTPESPEQKSPEGDKPYVLPEGYTWGKDEEFTPQDQARLDRAEAKRERKRAAGKRWK